MIVADESYDWSCGGTMGRSYDHESPNAFTLCRADLNDSTVRDTLIRTKGAEENFQFADPILYHSVHRNRLIWYQTVSGCVVSVLGTTIPLRFCFTEKNTSRSLTE